MKKLLLGAAALLFMVSCSGNGTAEKSREDSALIADSMAEVEASVEQASQDSIRQDSIAKAENAAKFDVLIDEFESAIVSYKNRALRTNGDSKSYNLFLKCKNLEAKLNKEKKELTSEQLSRFKAEKSKLNKYKVYIEP